ncbi:MAG: glycosyltransferase [Clostridium sp.]|nr:glycosyltransferase [Clostridium sp.]
MENAGIRLSILIPTYNFDCTPLTEALSRQAQHTTESVEIIIGDDGSTDEKVVCRINRCSLLPHVRVVRPPHNIGRSAIRNLLFKESAGSHLLFVDSDGVPTDDAFLSRYLTAIHRIPRGVVCGGIVHPDVLPSPSVSLRWRYEKASERRFTQEWKEAHPHDCFRSFNFAIDRESFSHILFDETIRHYGFEDVLFGWQLKERGICVVHIDNPLLNTDIESNEVYLHKNEESLQTLARHYGKLHKAVRIARLWDRLHDLHLILFLNIGFRLLRPLLIRNLMGQHPFVLLLNLYKIGYLNSCRLTRTD